MDMYGGYYMVSLAGADLAETTPVYIEGAYQAVYKGIHTDKPILIYHLVYGDLKMSPMYGILSKENNVLYLKTIYALIEITSADQVIIIPTPSIDDVEAEIELIRIELENLDGQISDINDSIADIESDIESAQGDIADLHTDLNTVDTMARAAVNTVSTLSGTVSGLSSDMADLSSDMTALSGVVSSLSGTVSTLSSDMTTLSGTVSTLSSDVSDLTSDLADEVAYTHGGGLFASLVNALYPIGCYFETSDRNFDPNNSLGGTWVLETEGQVHVSSGANYPVSGAPTDTNDGGSKDAIIPFHRHDIAAHSTESSGSVDTGYMSENASHHHTFSYAQYNRAAGSATTSALQYSGSTKTTGNTSVDHTHTVPDHVHSIAGHYTNYAGTSGNVTDANMQPYIIVNRWHRTA